MQVSHVADDYAAIARRLKELQEESRNVDERRSAPPKARVWLGYPTGRAPRLVEQASSSDRR
jgi:hypothetical protein